MGSSYKGCGVAKLYHKLAEWVPERSRLIAVQMQGKGKTQGKGEM
jgi:hypothetical protein